MELALPNLIGTFKVSIISLMLPSLPLLPRFKIQGKPELLVFAALWWSLVLRAGRSGWRLLSCPASEHCESSLAGPRHCNQDWFLLAKPQNSRLQNGCLPLGSAPQADNNGAPAAANAGEQNLRRKSATSFKGEHPKFHRLFVLQHDISEFATKRDHSGSLPVQYRACSKSKW